MMYCGISWCLVFCLGLHFENRKQSGGQLLINNIALHINRMLRYVFDNINEDGGSFLISAALFYILI